MTELLQQKLKQAQLLALKKELMVQRQQEALQEQAALEPRLDLLLEKTRELQKLVGAPGHWEVGAGPPGDTPKPCLPFPSPPLCLQIEADISKRYGGRPVNLLGTSL